MPIFNLGVVERQSGSQAGRLADWRQGEVVLLDSHWHGTGSGFGHWPRPKPHYGKKKIKHQRGAPDLTNALPNSPHPPTPSEETNIVKWLSVLGIGES